MVMLVVSFLVIAALYASVGFGGGSSYTALLVLVDTDYRLVPIIALICNLIVVAGGTLHFVRAGLLRANVVLPFTILSVPMAWLGGVMPVSKSIFLLILGLALLGAGAAMLIGPPQNSSRIQSAPAGRLWALGLTFGSGLGYLAGVVGIGGGIFLAPVLYLLRLAPPKVVAATASFFILVNSAAGLLGQWQKLGALEMRGDLSAYIWLFPAVLIGGQLGSRAGIRVLNPRTVRLLTAFLVIFVGGRLLFSWYTALT